MFLCPAHLAGKFRCEALTWSGHRCKRQKADGTNCCKGEQGRGVVEEEEEEEPVQGGQGAQVEAIAERLHICLRTTPRF